MSKDYGLLGNVVSSYSFTKKINLRNAYRAIKASEIRRKKALDKKKNKLKKMYSTPALKE